MKEMVGGCCVCSDDRGWPENPLVYCDGQSCTVAVHQGKLKYRLRLSLNSLLCVIRNLNKNLTTNCDTLWKISCSIYTLNKSYIKLIE